MGGTHVASLTVDIIDAAARSARVVDHAVTLIVDDTKQVALVLPSGRVTVRACERRWELV